jgi:hypothetical protein
VSKVLITVQVTQDGEDKRLEGNRTFCRQFWCTTMGDLTRSLDTVEYEASQMFEFAATNEPEKEGDDE